MNRGLLEENVTDFVHDNMLINYCLGDNDLLLIKSFVHNNHLDIHFNINCFYFMMIGMHKKFIGLDNLEELHTGVHRAYHIYNLFKQLMEDSGYSGNTFLIKEDNSKQFGILMSTGESTTCTPFEMAKILHDQYMRSDGLYLVPFSKEYTSTSFVGPYCGYEQIHQAFLDARELNDLLFFGVRDMVITKEYRDKTARPCDVTAILGNVRRLTNAVCTGTRAQALRQTDYIICDMIAPSYEMGNFSALFSAVDDLLGMLETVYPDRIRITRRAQETFFTLEDYRLWLRDTLTAVFDQLKGVPRCSPTILMALSYINRNYMRDLSLTQLSEYVYANASVLSTEFNNEVGMSLSEYVTGLRIKKAQELLRDTDLTVPQIAEQTGFSGAKYFREIFKRQTGVSPQGYREGREL